MRSQSKAGPLTCLGMPWVCFRGTIRRSSSASSGPLARRATSRSPARTGTTLPLHRALTEIYNLTTPSRKLLELLASRGAADLAPLLDRANAEQLKHYFNGWNEAHDVLDVLEEHASIRLTAAELVDSLRKSLPRLYSIASSQAAHPGQVHLLVVSVRYIVRGRAREGVCSTWLADRWPDGATADMYLQNQQKHFAMPSDPETPMIMIGPGTGLAPFRAFVEERVVTGATGRNWLFFGEQRRASDFFYEDQFSGYVRDGRLRLDVAFSRDQAEKIYVQHRMREQASDLWAWLEEGAEFFVCGDKERMAADVDRELHRLWRRRADARPIKRRRTSRRCARRSATSATCTDSSRFRFDPAVENASSGLRPT